MNTGRLEKLCNSFGVSSAEHGVAKMLRSCYEPLCDEIKRDRLGSIFAIKKAKNPDAPTFMIASPLDEVGLMISEVKKKGHFPLFRWKISHAVRCCISACAF